MNESSFSMMHAQAGSVKRLNAALALLEPLVQAFDKLVQAIAAMPKPNTYRVAWLVPALINLINSPRRSFPVSVRGKSDTNWMDRGLR